MMPLRISRLRCGLAPRRFGGAARSINANCSSLSQNRSAIVLLHVNRGVESGLLESGQALETWELGFERLTTKSSCKDEARVGQQGSLTYLWAERGSRPAVPR